MADWAFFDSSRFATRGTAAITGGGTIVSPTTLNTKGSWTQLVNYVPFDADVVTVDAMRLANVAGFDYALMDVGVGTFGSEQVIFSNFPVTNSEAEVRAYHYRMPVPMRAGEVICARLQSVSARHIISVGFRFESHGFAHPAPGGGRIKTYGPVTTTSELTIVPSGAANVKGAWTQITASTTADIGQITIVAGDEDSSGLATAWYAVDVGIGPAGQEKIIIPDMILTSNAGSSALNPYMIGPIPVSIPAASRIAMRLQCTTTSRDIGFAIIGISR